MYETTHAKAQVAKKNRRKYKLNVKSVSVIILSCEKKCAQDKNWDLIKSQSLFFLPPHICSTQNQDHCPKMMRI